MKRIIPLSQLLTFKSVYREDDNWDALLAEMKANPVHWLTVTQLVEELKTNRFFREPVYVGKDEKHDPDSFWVFDGTHRACAYLLAGVSEVEIVYEHEHDFDWYEPKYLVETEIIGIEGYAMQEPDDDRSPALWQALLSLRLNEKVWLTSAASSSNMERLVIFWENAAEDCTDEEINAAACAQLAKVGYNPSRLQVRTARRLNEF